MKNDKKVLLILGGARSGKSRYAQELGKKSEKVLFVATATAGDEDMRRRIEKHQQTRPAAWRTLESADHIGKSIEENIAGEDLVIIDCLTLLVSNIFCCYDEGQFENVADEVLEQQVLAEISELQECLKKVDASFILVSNEVGLGVVPDNRIGRLYRDLLGRVNQVLAGSADEVYLMVAGIPLRVKSKAT